MTDPTRPPSLVGARAACREHATGAEHERERRAAYSGVLAVLLAVGLEVALEHGLRPRRGTREGCSQPSCVLRRRRASAKDAPGSGRPRRRKRRSCPLAAGRRARARGRPSHSSRTAGRSRAGTCPSRRYCASGTPGSRRPAGGSLGAGRRRAARRERQASREGEVMASSLWVSALYQPSCEGG